MMLLGASVENKGQPDKVKLSGRRPRRRRLKGKRGRGTSADEKIPVVGFVQRGGCVMLKVVPNVQQATTRPLFEQYVVPKT